MNDCKRCKYWEHTYSNKGVCTLYDIPTVTWDTCEDWSVSSSLEKKGDD